MNLKLIAVLSLLSVSAFGAAPAGNVPPGMPNKLAVGLFEDTGKTWMKTSTVPWQIRYRYLTYRWSTNWGNGPRDGAFAGQFFRDSDTQGFMPAISYYEIYDIPPSGVGQLQKMQQPAAMLEYFQDFKLLMQQAKTFGKPVLIMVEPDATGFLQGSVGGNPNVLAAVASTGMPELVGLPNTAAGWGLAFLRIRQAVGATNVILGLHVSGWATGQDLFHSATTVPLPAAVDQVYGFLAPLGLAGNQTGATYDVLVGDPLDRDADYYRVVRGENRTWDPSDTASVTSKSFNRYAEWMRLLNVKSGKRWVLWQLPIGNASSLNVCNRGQLNQGYKDNRVEYFFGTGSAPHRQLFVDSGAIALLFGQGEGCQSSYQVDGNQIRTNVARYYASPGGGLSLVPAAVPVDAGLPVAIDAGTPVVVVPVVPTGYVFSTATLGFIGSNATVKTIASPTDTAMKVTFTGSAPATPNQVSLANPVGVPKSTLLKYTFYVPAGMPLSSVQVFVQENSATSWKWIANWQPVSALKLGEYNTITLTTGTGVLQAIGIEFQFATAYTGAAYVSSIVWNAPVVDAGSPPVIDAGTVVVDSGTPDAGSPFVDSGTGVVDSGPSPLDAGLPIDGGSPSAHLRIMPLGNSITAEDHAWRCEVARLLRLAGNTVALVGSATSPYDECPFHEGHPGFTSGNISSGVIAWLNAALPDLVLLEIGTNDLAWWTNDNGTKVANDVDALVTKIQTTRPGVRIVVQTIPPMSSFVVPPNNVNRQVLNQQFNTQLRIRIAAREAAGQRVRLADTNLLLTLADLRDGIHPTPQAGVTKIAPALVAAIQQVLLVP